MRPASRQAPSKAYNDVGERGMLKRRSLMAIVAVASSGGDNLTTINSQVLIISIAPKA